MKLQQGCLDGDGFLSSDFDIGSNVESQSWLFEFLAREKKNTLKRGSIIQLL